MARHHANVNYVEPNYSSVDWKVDDEYDRAPRLEDYCVMFNIEVEVFNRENIVNGETTQKDVLVLSCNLNKSTSSSTVNFLGGTKIECGDKDNTYMRYATTNYADMYVGDLVNYGTTEMIGVKSVDIEYEKSCVPIITIQFTDVRGMSLFQPTELSRSDIYDGIRGLNVDNIAQTFFQCFFKLPSPKYTIYLKGFYGKPVCYEVMCDKFDTKFNSSTGDFDVTARFIGYNYSFLTDVSMDALIAAPYSDYYGKKYWDDAVSEGRFVLPNKDNTANSPMPTLVEVRNKISSLLKNTPPIDTPLSAEEKWHVEEIDELTKIKMMYESWYSTLYEALVEKYTKDYCYLFKEKGGNMEFYRILLLTPHTVSDASNLSLIYDSLGNDFKKINNDLYAAVEKYNADTSTNHSKLVNVSKDFSSYKSRHLFNRMYLNQDGDVVFNGFDKDNSLGESDVVNHVFFGVDYKDDEDTRQKQKTHRDYVLSKIYNDGVTQYINCYCIEVPYDAVQNRISALQNDANSSVDDKNNKARIKALNDYLLNEMGWYPSVENFTKIMMAHMETLMYMMYKTVDATNGRTVSDMGVTVGEGGTCPDVNSNSDTLPPFPRVTREVIGDDGVVKKEDDWVGNVGANSFVEADFVNGLFNGIDKADSFIASENYVESVNSESGDTQDQLTTSIVKYPLSPFDLFIAKSPYGDASNMMDDLSGKSFAGRVAMRMYSLLKLNKLMFTNPSLNNSSNIEKIARVEAENFASCAKATNSKFVDFIKGGEMTSSTILGMVMGSDKSNPWGNGILFNSNMNLVGYKTKGGTHVYPIQNDSYSDIYKSFSKINCGVYGFNDSYIDYPPASTQYKKYSVGTFGLGACAILNDYKEISSKLSNANSSVNDDYSVIYNSLVSSGFEDDDVSQMVSISSFDDRMILYKICGVKNNGGKLSFDNASDFIDTYSSFNSSPIVLDGYSLSKREVVLARALIGIWSNSLWDVLNNMKVFWYMPKYYALKIGALVCASSTIFWNSKLSNPIGVISKHLQVIGGGYDKVIKRIQVMSPMVRAQYAKYFLSWASSSNANVLYSLATSKQYYKSINNKLNIDTTNKSVMSLSNDLASTVMVINLTTTYSRKNDISVQMCKVYLDAFINKLREIYSANDIVPVQQINTNPTVAQPNKSNDDMKKGLYSYLKLLYDKWVPSSSFDNWKIENYFEGTKDSEDVGDTFYFIDSYYNKIGQKLLINPKKLCEKIDAFLTYQDINVMMLGFMSDIYSQNKCMLMAIQNFADISKRGSMDEMFKPLPYNSIDWSTVNKHPSFVVVYPYEPSKHLNVSNNEYNDDSFMLNDENETPIAIRSRNYDGMYYIPAFGVTYGRQYQSYFKSVDINMQSPVATQQAIKAKHYILKDSNGAKNAVGAVAQDLYDIYSTQSYTCNVTMMGCAWVQPMMYFVLLNIPMFRGSYLIMKVKHHLVPGDMTTTFTGCRMAYVSNPLVENIFTDDSNTSQSVGGGVTREQFADIDNNCPYKVYPLFQASYDGISYTFPQDKSKESFARTMFCAYKKYRNSLNDDVTMALVAQDCLESTWGKDDHGGYNYGGVTAYGSQYGKSKYQKFYSIDDYVNGKITHCLDRNFDDWDNPKFSAEDYLSKIQDGNKKYATDPNYEKKVKGMLPSVKKRLGGFVSNAQKITNVQKTAKKNEKVTNEDVANALFEALQKSISSTPSIKTELKKSYISKSNVMMITQADGKSDYLGNVFDLLLNGYYDYVKELYWVYDSKNGNAGNPLHIDVVAEMSPKANQRKVYVCETKNIESSKSRTVGSDANKKLRLALYKKYGGINKEVPQVKDASTYKGLSMADCSDIMRVSTVGASSSTGGSISQKKIELFGESWNGIKPRSWCESFLKNITVMYRTTKEGPVTPHTLKFHRKLEGNLQNVFNELAKDEKFYVKEIGTYSYRRVVGNPNRLSNHSYGIAIDVNPQYNPYIKNGKVLGGHNEYDQDLSIRSSSDKIVKIFAKYGFGWGGTYKDYMHFSYFDGR